ncbi:zinc ribbon domain-containing protein [Halalkalibacter oceani]|uniref:zinc ribbon domain-containing protein n=1 Tax=Halalkalibacter oceani TaxID=1653776 RepID=UPI00339671A8
MSLFSRKIKCTDCGKYHKSKKARKKQIYVCSTYDREGKDACNRNKVDEEFLLEMLNMRYKNLSTEEIIGKVVEVEINSMEIRIKVIDGEDLIARDKLLQF